jgi:hypothetical protein
MGHYTIWMYKILYLPKSQMKLPKYMALAYTRPTACTLEVAFSLIRMQLCSRTRQHHEFLLLAHFLLLYFDTKVKRLKAPFTHYSAAAR